MNWTEIILLLLAFLITRLAHNRYATPLRAIPGPIIASCTRLWKLTSTLAENTQWDHIALHKRYGTVVRTGPNEVSFASPRAARAILSAGNGFRKTDFYTVVPPPDNPGLFAEVREDVHAVKRRVAASFYSMTAMRRLSPFIDGTIDFLAARLDGFCGENPVTVSGSPPGEREGSPVLDLGTWLHYFAFDVLGELAFSRSFGFLATGSDVESAIRAIDDSQKYNGVVGQVPVLDYFLRRNPLCRFVPALDPARHLITRISWEEVARRRPFGASPVGAREDLLAGLIRGHLRDPESFREGDVFALAHGAL
ncbi:cytochrome P450 [Xylaria intraflava]|nr:cytochrome P450 [Xylaria intraflava]